MKKALGALSIALASTAAIADKPAKLADMGAALPEPNRKVIGF